MSATTRVIVLGCGSSAGVPRIGGDWGDLRPGRPAEPPQPLLDHRRAHDRRRHHPGARRHHPRPAQPAPRRRRRPPRRRRLDPRRTPTTSTASTTSAPSSRTAAPACRSGPTPRPPTSCSPASPTSSSSPPAASIRRSSTSAPSTGPSRSTAPAARSASSPSGSPTAASTPSASASATSPTSPTSPPSPRTPGPPSTASAPSWSTPSATSRTRPTPTSRSPSSGSARAAPRRGILTNMHNDLDYATLAAELPGGDRPRPRRPRLRDRLSARPVIVTVLLVVLPVFLVIGGGWLATRSGVFSASAVDGLMVYTQSFAVPCLLFRGLVDLDLGAAFDPRLLALLLHRRRRRLRRRGPPRAPPSSAAGPARRWRSASGRCSRTRCSSACRSWTRAYGPRRARRRTSRSSRSTRPSATSSASPRWRSSAPTARGLVATARAIGRTVFRNALMIALALGFAVNLLGIPLPAPVRSAVDMIADSALPAALFALGGVFTRYAVRSSLGEAGTITVLSLVVHPAIAYVLSTQVFALPPEFVRGAVVTAAMAPGRQHLRLREPLRPRPGPGGERHPPRHRLLGPHRLGLARDPRRRAVTGLPDALASGRWRGVSRRPVPPP